MIPSIGMWFRSFSGWANRRRSAPILGAALLLVVASCGRESARQAVSRSVSLYDEGRYDEALPLLRRDQEISPEDGGLLFRIGFARYVSDRDRDALMQTWGEAERLIETEIASGDGVKLEHLYYLSKINLDQYDYDAMRRYARRAVERYEEGGDPGTLEGADWFRLGRLHEYLNEASKAEAAYRRAHSMFQQENSRRDAYRALTAAWIADLDFRNGHYERAATGYDESHPIAASLGVVHPFRHGLALFGAGRIDDAIKKFEEAQGSRAETEGDAASDSIAREAQYAEQLARKAGEAGSLAEEDLDGVSITSMLDDLLDQRIRDAAAGYRRVREKYAYRPGDPLPSEMGEHQKRFAALLRERLIRDARLSEFCAAESMDDLVLR